MKTLFSKGISCYASDTAGVCSALFELGGMTVIHDASGCNSTYSTFDEPRWYNSDSMIYISALTENDMVFGNDNKFVEDILRAADELQPRFIALACSVIPLMTGCDLDAIAFEVEQRSNIPAFTVNKGGMHHYWQGAAEAWIKLAKRFMLPPEEYDPTDCKVNILGATPLDFSLNGNIDSIRNYLANNGFTVQSTWAMDSTLDELSTSATASVNLVISNSGLQLAEYMFGHCNIPFVCGLPIGRAGAVLLKEKLQEAIQSKVNIYNINQNTSWNGKAKCSIIGETVFASSLAYTLQQESNYACQVVDPLNGNRRLLLDNDLQCGSESEIEAAVADSDLVIADNMYEVIVPQNVDMIKIPHVAFSGRCYRKEQLNLMDKEINWESLLCRR